eukprot:902231-Rhodomonas_salina.2
MTARCRSQPTLSPTHSSASTSTSTPSSASDRDPRHTGLPRVTCPGDRRPLNPHVIGTATVEYECLRVAALSQCT